MEPIPDDKLKVGMRIRVEKGPKVGGNPYINYPVSGTVSYVDEYTIQCNAILFSKHIGWYTFYLAEDDIPVVDVGE